MINQIGIIPKWHTLQDLKTLNLKPEELHLWWSPLTLNSQQKSVAYSLLNERQLEKYHRRATPELQNSYLAGRYHLFTLLAAYLNCQPNQIKLQYNRLNKPFLAKKLQSEPPLSLEFNFTDTNLNGQSFALYAFCWNNQVGVDLEARKRAGDLEKIARRRFSKTELDFVSSEPGSLDPEKCLAIWTRKEAYGKARGIGINFQMNQRNLVGESDYDFTFSDEKHNWRLVQIQPNEDFIACVVHENHAPLSIKAFKSS